MTHPPRPLRVVIADDELRVRRGLAMRLDLEPDLDVVAQAATTPDAVAVAASSRPDVIVLDVRMPPDGGLAAIPPLRAEVPGIRIVVLSIHDEQTTRARVRRTCADAFVSKSAGDEALLRAIRNGTP